MCTATKSRSLKPAAKPQPAADARPEDEPQGKYAIGIVEHGRIESIVEERLQLVDALAFVGNYNKVTADRQAVLLAHPLTAAVKGGAA
jgi:hypothetical protein